MHNHISLHGTGCVADVQMLAACVCFDVSLTSLSLCKVNPEAFAPVPMLWVDVRLNGKKLSAFVDTGERMLAACRHCRRS